MIATIELLRRELRELTQFQNTVHSEKYVYESYRLNGETVLIRINKDTGGETLFFTVSPEEVMGRIKKYKMEQK